MKLEWHTESRKISELVGLVNNPRKISDKRKRQLIKSLEKYNVVDIPVVDIDNTIVSGNQRVNILCELGRGYQSVDVRVPNRKLTENERKEYCIIANSHSGEFDVKSIGENYKDIVANMICDVDIKGYINEIEIPDDADDVSDEEETTDKYGVKPGQIWVMGNHRIACGDSGDPWMVNAVMRGDKATVIFTDPPYGVSIGDKNKMLNSFQKAGRNLTNIENDSLKPEELKNVLVPIFINSRELAAAEDCTYFVTAPGGDLGMMMMMMKDAGLPIRHVLMWLKNSPTFSMGRLDYDYQHEPILLTWCKSHKRPMGGQHRTSVWKVDKPRSSKEHPTMKPVELYINAYMNNSDSGDVVYEPFSGSGTAIIAAELTGRKCRAIEIDPHYVAVALNRWSKLTDKEPVLL